MRESEIRMPVSPGVLGEATRLGVFNHVAERITAQLSLKHALVAFYFFPFATSRITHHLRDNALGVFVPMFR